MSLSSRLRVLSSPWLALTSRHRSASADLALGLWLAFVAGAINAGGFRVLHVYTSHMSGFASQLPYAWVVQDVRLMLSAVGALGAFVLGAMTATVQIQWARRLHLQHIYALPLFLEAWVLLAFGLVGALTLRLQTPFGVPLTVLLLAFLMGLQNALTTKASRKHVRSTHMTGHLTDIGIEWGRLLRRRTRGLQAEHRRLFAERMKLYGGLVLAFIGGGYVGVLGFGRLGFVSVLPLASVLGLMSVPALAFDVWRRRGMDPWHG
ncbi:hypothetical protein CCO03_00775 [Comamonas serinivorans]|uniref:DUF1275 family protein n=1 Tax=Comamonas serinivorans TaxID=1082851 RepID=A0A1Y0ESG5_9BURK|nr:YoaK family protein [Comamonas serinivorans]ARU06553.1 hypothetical protein CCO03_00775 [Comamonas serinivorans]